MLNPNTDMSVPAVIEFTALTTASTLFVKSRYHETSFFHTQCCCKGVSRQTHQSTSWAKGKSTRQNCTSRQQAYAKLMVCIHLCFLLNEHDDALLN